MANEAKLYRARADEERLAAVASDLPRVRDRSLRAAERWEELAAKAEQAATGAAQRQDDSRWVILPRSGR